MKKIIRKLFKKQRIYISGPVTGLDYCYVHAKFNIIEYKLKNAGIRPISPIKYIDEKTDWQAAMDISIRLLLASDGIYMMDGWEKSDGATCELFIALITNKDIYFEGEAPQTISLIRLLNIATNYYNK